MLTKLFRFHGRGSLRYVYTKGYQVRIKQLSLKYGINPRRQESRCAVVVSKKVTKKAPTRNRIRRRVYEVIRQKWPMIKPGHDIIITVFDETIAEMDHVQLIKLIDQLLRRADIYK